MFKSMVLKGEMERGGRFENAMKTLKGKIGEHFPDFSVRYERAK